MRVAYFGTWERGYPRNEQVTAALASAGVEVDVVHEEMWTGTHKFGLTPTVLPRLARAELRLARAPMSDNVDALVVGYPGHFDLWSARRHRKPVVFNAMVSLYDTFVEDRKRFHDGSLAAKALCGLDRVAFRAADLVVADTHANADFMRELAGIEEVGVCYLGAEERLFRPTWQRREDFHVLFVGKPAPLHGLELILEAARRLPASRFEWSARDRKPICSTRGPGTSSTFRGSSTNELPTNTPVLGARSASSGLAERQTGSYRTRPFRRSPSARR